MNGTQVNHTESKCEQQMNKSFDISKSGNLRQEAKIPLVRSAVEESNYVVIGGIPIALPSEAKYVVQDNRGLWYFSERKPRMKFGDWTPGKKPIQLTGANGEKLPRVVKSEVVGNWQDSIQETIKKSQLPQVTI